MDFGKPAFKDFSPSPTQAQQPPVLSEEDLEPVQKITNGLFIFITSPIWLSCSIIAEVVGIPLLMTLNTLKRFEDNLTLLAIGIITSPVIFALFVLIGTFLMPISVIMKIYDSILAEDFSESVKCLIYPSVHPVFEDYLKPVERVRKGKVNPSIASLKTTTNSYVPPTTSFGAQEALFCKAIEEEQP